MNSGRFYGGDSERIFYDLIVKGQEKLIMRGQSEIKKNYGENSVRIL
jgi:hypothetical protein